MNHSPLWQETHDYIQQHDRILFSCCGEPSGPFVIFSAGIHGNEPTGVLALRNVFKKIVKDNLPLNGSLLALIGNRSALTNGKRYSVVDLNRLWYDDNLNKLHTTGFAGHELNPDVLEMIKIDRVISDFENQASGKEHYFIDLHTTSAPSIPFAVADKKEHCLSIALQFPLPVVININEYIHGTMLNYFENRNFHGLVFEAGQHEDGMSVKKHESIIWLSLLITGMLKKENVPNYNAHFELLSGLNEDPHQQFEIIHRQELKTTDHFKMQPDYVNFQRIDKGELLAHLNGIPVYAPKEGRLFMPLYQSKGEDGFFIVQRVN